MSLVGLFCKIDDFYLYFEPAHEACLSRQAIATEVNGSLYQLYLLTTVLRRQSERQSFLEFLAIATLLLVIPPWSDAQLTAEIPYLESTMGISLSEVMTIIIFFHQKRYRNFKRFYCDHLRRYHQEDFPKLVSYTRFFELMRDA